MKERCECPKCGAPNGFTTSKPHYHSAAPDYERMVVEPGHPPEEHLDFFCILCGYRIDRPTHDKIVVELGR